MLVIGDEILGGFVQDTNSGWLARRLLGHGVPLTRVHTVPDDFGAIDEALQAELARSRPRVIFTSGGIGSTPDDITFEAIAASLGRDLVTEPTMERRIEAALTWTADQGMAVDDEFRHHMLRMAQVPEGAVLVASEVSWAPGIRVDLEGGSDQDGVTVIILPGVPYQFEAIVRSGVEPDLIAGRNEPVAVREVSHEFPESALNPVFVRIVDQYPAVKLGSYPGVPMTVRLTGPEEEVAAATAEVQAYIDELLQDPAGERLARAWSERLGAAEERHE